MADPVPFSFFAFEGALIPNGGFHGLNRPKKDAIELSGLDNGQGGFGTESTLQGRLVPEGPVQNLDISALTELTFQYDSETYKVFLIDVSFTSFLVAADEATYTLLSDFSWGSLKTDTPLDESQSITTIPTSDVFVPNEAPTFDDQSGNLPAVDEEGSISLDLSKLDIDDNDDDDLTLTLAVDEGTLGFSTPQDPGLTVNLSVDEQDLTIQGKADLINAYLDGTDNLTYNAPDEFSEGGNPAELEITLTDGVNQSVEVGIKEITINAVDDTPEFVLQVETLDVQEDLSAPIDFPQDAFDDPDSTTMTVRIEVNEGSLGLSPFVFQQGETYGSITIGATDIDMTDPGSGGEEGTFVTLSGTIEKINEFLSDDMFGLQYRGAENASGLQADTVKFFASNGDIPNDAEPVKTLAVNITPQADAPTEQVTITGTPRVGQTLTADISTIEDPDGFGENDGPTNVTYQWYRGWGEQNGPGGVPGDVIPNTGGGHEPNGPKGEPIQGATEATYTLTAEDFGKTIFVVVSYEDALGEDQSTSEATAEVGRAPTPPNPVDPNEGEVLEGSGGDDALTGGDKNDTIRSDDGDDRLSGRKGDDSIDGGLGDDTIGGGQGRDTLNGGDDDDLLLGRKGGDSLFGDSGEDTLRGNQGQDRLEGGDEDDRLFGNLGNDRLNGGRGEDTLNGGSGDDVLTGGAGSDIFIFRDKFGQDRITDFEIGEDIIRIRGSADDVSDLTFTQFGNAVIVSFAETEIFVNNVTIDEINNPDNFLFG